MSRFFDVKTAECDSNELLTKIKELETEWLTALLIRSGVSKIIIDKAINDENYSANNWRDYLFEEKNITIIRDMSAKSVSVFQISRETGEKIKIAGWENPSVIRKKGGKFRCVLELKYWQII